MSEFWLISAPGEKTCQQTWEKLNKVTMTQNSLSTNYKFHIPDLKVGSSFNGCRRNTLISIRPCGTSGLWGGGGAVDLKTCWFPKN